MRRVQLLLCLIVTVLPATSFAGQQIGAGQPATNERARPKRIVRRSFRSSRARMCSGRW